MEPSSYLGMAMAMLLVAVTPGPAVFAVTSTALTAGIRQSCYLNLGIITADYIFILLALFGMSSLTTFFGSAFLIIKYLCVIYLLWIGYTVCRSSPGSSNITHTQKNLPSSAWHTGLALSLSNPKAILFYAALFPAFFPLENLQVFDVILIMLTSSICFGSVNFIYAIAATKGKSILQSSIASDAFNKIGGSAVIVTAICIAIKPGHFNES